MSDTRTPSPVRVDAAPPLPHTAAGSRYVEAGHARGEVVVTVA